MTNAPGCSYPIPRAGSQDWPALSAMFRGMAEKAQLRSQEIRALDDPEDDQVRAVAAAYASAYHFAAHMIDLSNEKPSDRA